MRQRKRRDALREMGKRRQWNRNAPGRLHIDFSQKGRVLPPLLFQGQHYVILIDRFVYRRDLSLAECVVKSAVHRLGGEAEPGCTVAVDHDVRGESGILLVRTYVRQLWKPR